MCIDIEYSLRYIIVNCKKIQNNVNIMLPLIIKELYMYMHGRHWKDTQDHL